MLSGKSGDIAAKIAVGLACYFVFLLAIGVAINWLQTAGTPAP